MFSLVIYFIYSSVYMSVPISQFILPPLPHLVTISLFLHLWLCFCFANKFISTIFLDSAYKRYHMIFVFLWLTSLSVIISRSIRGAANGIILFFFYGWVIYIVYIYCIYIVYFYHIFFIYSSVDGNLGCFYVLAIVRSASIPVLRESGECCLMSGPLTCR